MKMIIAMGAILFAGCCGSSGEKAQMSDLSCERYANQIAAYHDCAAMQNCRVTVEDRYDYRRIQKRAESAGCDLQTGALTANNP